MAWRGHNVNKLFIENMFDFFKSTIGIFGKKLVAMFIQTPLETDGNGFTSLEVFSRYKLSATSSSYC